MPFNPLHAEFILYNVYFVKTDVEEGRYDQTVRAMKRYVE